MARFRFRLEASLCLAEQALETTQRVLAKEVQRWQWFVKTCEIQQERFETAQEGQREAGRHRPEELGAWQVYVLEQLQQLRRNEAERQEQEVIMEEARHRLLEAHRDVEKFRRLKEKQAKAFVLTEAQKEQKISDETGQILNWRQKKAIS